MRDPVENTMAEKTETDKISVDTKEGLCYIIKAVSCSRKAGVAQMVERVIGNDEVTGPIPVPSSFILLFYSHFLKASKGADPAVFFIWLIVWLII